MTVWDLKALCEQKIKDEQLTEEQRNAWQNALKSVEIQIELMTPKQLKLLLCDVSHKIKSIMVV